MSITTLILIGLIFFLIAMLYSSVGFGGGSSYLAILVLFIASFYTIRSLALLCNILVVSGSFYWFYKKGLFDRKQFLPFVITSIPLAFLGATFRLEETLFFIILGGALATSSLFLLWQSTRPSLNTAVEPTQKYPTYINYILGAAIGFLSGLVGIGGGIFLAPLLHHLRWGTSKKIAALACFFIGVNSISGITGLIAAGTLDLPWKEALVLGVAVLLGGQIGVRFSLNKLSAKNIKLVTAILVLIVGARILWTNGFAAL